MDAAAYLALLSKAKLVFESEGTFLSFPVLSQLTYDVEDLRFDNADDPARGLAALSEFSQVTNRIQRGVIAAIDGDEYLWDVYDDVLSMAEVADLKLTEAQEQEYAAAVGLLYTTSPEGLRVASPALTSYTSFRDAHIRASEEYKKRKLEADLATDPAAQAQWAVDEPALQQAIEDIETSWRSVGRRAEIEAAQQVERSVSAKAPALRWDAWRGSFMADLDLATDEGQTRYAATVFSPTDALERDDWLLFTMTGDEMVALGEQAPQELRDILGDVATASEIESVSFEYRSVALDRAWLDRSVFESRFWRLGPDGGELSDGEDPPQGRCPAFAVALVLARRITVTWKSRPPAAEPEDAGRTLVLRPEIIEHLRQVRPDLAPRRPVATTVIRARPEIDLAPRREVPDLRPRVDLSVVRPRILIRPSLPDLVAQPAPEPVIEPVPEPAPEEQPPSSTGDQVTILGFLCKRLRRCPDPDPAYDWA